MTKHNTGTREQWRAARLELLKAEKELTHRSDQLAKQRQELPWVRVEKEYLFDTDEGSASLADLFKGRSQLARLSFYVRAGLQGWLPVLLVDCRWVQWHRCPFGQSRCNALGRLACAAR